jgi:hypothetical protein
MPDLDFAAFASTFRAQGLGPGAQREAEPTVYLGQTGAYLGSILVHNDKRLPIDDAIQAFYAWGDDERAQWGKRLYGAGVIRDPGDFNGMLEAWKYAVTQTASYNAAGRSKLTPWAFMDMLERTGGTPGQKVDVPKTTTSSNTQYNIPSKSDAGAAIRTLFKEQLGRDPEDGELDRYTSMLISKFRANPASTTTTTTTDPDGNSTSKSTSKSGFNPAGYLEDQVQGDPEWGAYQAATTYFNALQGALGAPG